jgi:hypothetical protein
MMLDEFPSLGKLEILQESPAFLPAYASSTADLSGHRPAEIL